jgi:hypothetical protein
VTERIRYLLRWLHPDLADQDGEFRGHLDAQAITGIKMLGLLLLSLAGISQVLLHTLYLAESVKTEQGMLLSLRFFGLGALLLVSLKMPFIKRVARPLLLAVMFFLIADTLYLQLRLFSIHRAQIGLFMSALCFIAFTYLPYRSWVIGAFGLFGLFVIFGLSWSMGLGIHPYTDTGVFWLAAQFASLGVITIFFRSAILKMQIDIHYARQDEIDDVKSTLTRGENERAEFKSSFRFDYQQQRANAEIQQAVIKAIAGFLNSKGGMVILGVDDKGTPLGLVKDYLTLKKKNSDGYELAINQAVTEGMGAEVCQNLRFSFLTIDEKEICVIHVRASSRPVYVESKDQSTFYIRTGNSTQALDTRRAVDYIQSHWKKVRV